MSRNCWVEAGNDADYTKFKMYGITSAYFDIRDQRLDMRYLRNVASILGGPPGVYAVSSWFPQFEGPTFADWVSARLTEIGAGPKSPVNVPKVSLDMETKDIAGFVVPALQRYRALRPKRVTEWTLEGLQGGLFTPALIAAIIRCNVTVAPQCYNGKMLPYAPDVVKDNLVRAGFPTTSVECVYASKAIDYLSGWNGTMFPMGELP